MVRLEQTGELGAGVDIKALQAGGGITSVFTSGRMADVSQPKEAGVFAKYKWPIIGIGVLALGIIVYSAAK